MIQYYSLVGCLMGACLDAIPSRAVGRRDAGLMEKHNVSALDGSEKTLVWTQCF